MGKRVDYCVVGVHFSEDRKCVETVRILPDTGDLRVTGLIMPRQQIIAGLQRGMTFTTAFIDRAQQTYELGQSVGLVVVDGTEYLRLDDSSIAADELGALPEY